LATGRVERRLAAILAADVANYSRLIGADEGGILQVLKAIEAELLDFLIPSVMPAGQDDG
jgi:adenylate cyclase